MRGGVLKARILGLLVALAGGPGCVLHTYQPLTGLHDPVVVDPQAQNLTDVTVRITCVPKDLLKLSDASALCRKIGALLEHQGAFVTTSVGGADEEVEQPEEGPRPVDLALELRARQVQEASPALGWAAMIATFTLAPAYTEFTFEQELTIRDASGFLLGRDEMSGRVVYWYGFGSWATAKLLDVTVREKPDEIVGDHADRALSEDLYLQISQAVFDAKIQWEVLQRTAGAPGFAP